MRVASAAVVVVAALLPLPAQAAHNCNAATGTWVVIPTPAPAPTIYLIASDDDGNGVSTPDETYLYLETNGTPGLQRTRTGTVPLHGTVWVSTCPEPENPDTLVY